MWKTKSPPKTLRVTKKLAQEFATMEPAPHDRPLSERRLQIYQRIIAAGNMRPLEWSRAHCEETDGVYRVNGKHTSTLLSGMDKLPELYVTIYEYECDTLDDVAKLYATFDSRIGARSTLDINHSFAATMPALAEVSIRTINSTISGIWYFSHQDSYCHFPPAERAEVILDHEDFALFMHALTSANQGQSRPLNRTPVVAAIYGSYNKDQDDARKFWEAVRDETGTSPDLPDRKLAKFLTTCSIRSGGSTAPGRYKVTSREIFVKCIHAWNAWRKKEKTNLNYYQKADIPDLM